MEEIRIPSKDEFISGCKAFRDWEHRDAMYKVTEFLVEHFWENPKDMANGLGVLLLTWNNAFYRFGIFDFDLLEKWIIKNKEQLNNFRKRSINSFNKEDEESIRKLFKELLGVLQIKVKDKIRRSPVAAAKTLHMLAPKFFPLWDDEIAKKYGCKWTNNEDSSNKYIKFCKINKGMFNKMEDYADAVSKEINVKKHLLKLIDEYNLAKFTKHWI